MRGWLESTSEAAEPGTYLIAIDNNGERSVTRVESATGKADERDAARLDWLLWVISGKEFRRVGIIHSDGATREDIDAAMGAPSTPETTPPTPEAK